MADNSTRRDAGPFAFLAGGGEMGERTRAFDWSKTPVGPLAGWPQSLKTLVRIMLDSRYAMWLGWGPDFTFFYNDAYARMTLGPKHPWALGKSAREVWSEIWDDIGPRAESVIRTGEATWDEGLLLFLERQGFPEETYHTFSYSPVPGRHGRCRRDAVRGHGGHRADHRRAAAADAAGTGGSDHDGGKVGRGGVPDGRHARSSRIPTTSRSSSSTCSSDDGRRARLAGPAGLGPDSPACPAEDRSEQQDRCWPFRRRRRIGQWHRSSTISESGSAHCRAAPGRSRRGRPSSCRWRSRARPGLAGFVVAGVSPRLVVRRRLPGIPRPAGRPDRHSHRQRTGLRGGAAAGRGAGRTRPGQDGLLLQRQPRVPHAADAHARARSRTFWPRPDGPLPPPQRERLEVVHRNGLRLQRLVNTLLDFSRIEAGRVRAAYEPTDLAAFTADLASNFRSAVRAGRAAARRSIARRWASRCSWTATMWEKIVLNLLSNAFKFTFEGEITVSLRRAGHAAELRVQDTGTGIPAEEMPRLFERFHRVENARGRTHEGSGIGLALVQELVKLHGGSITAESEVGRGTTFRHPIPLGKAHLPADRSGSSRTPLDGQRGPVRSWRRRCAGCPATGGSDDLGPDLLVVAERPVRSGSRARADDAVRPRVLVADDNADMRQYVLRLLAAQYARRGRTGR